MPNVKPDVSVCVTTYQHQPYIRRCLESISDCSFDGTVEILVGDDGSSDGTAETIRSLADQRTNIRPYFNARRLGPSGNLSALVAQANGRLIAHLDGDDYWLPGKLRLQCAFLDEHPGFVAVYSNAIVISPCGDAIGAFNKGLPARIDFHELLRRGNVLNHSSLLYRREVRNAVLEMPPPYIDYRLHLRLAAYGALAYIDEPLVAHRWRTSGSMVATMPRAVCDGHCDAFAEALRIGAAASDVRCAAARAWGKTLMQDIAALDPTNSLNMRRQLSNMSGLEVGTAWFLSQALLAPSRAVSSWRSRRNGVYFP